MAIDKVERFAAVINKTANKKVKEFEAQAEDFLTREVKNLEDEFALKLENRLSFESDRINSATNREITSFENESKKKISEKRMQIRSEIFRSVREKTQAFVQSEKYGEFLKKSVASLLTEVGEDAVIYARECDIDEVKAIAPGVEVKASDEIELGGLFASDKEGTYFVYDTLDSRCEEQFENFLSVADLSV